MRKQLVGERVAEGRHGGGIAGIRIATRSQRKVMLDC